MLSIRERYVLSCHLVLSLSTVGFAGQAEFFASTRKEESCTYRT